MEIFFELMLTALINVNTIDWDAEYKSVKGSNYLAIVLIVVCMLSLSFLMGFFWINREHWDSAPFQAKYGSLLEGLSLE